MASVFRLSSTGEIDFNDQQTKITILIKRQKQKVLDTIIISKIPVHELSFKIKMSHMNLL